MLDKVKLKTINNNSLIGDGNISVGGSDIVTSWENTLSDTKVPSEKLAKNTIDLKVNIAQGSTNKNKNVVTDNSGNITIEAKPTIPSKVSDLTNDSGFITSSSLPTKTSDLTNDGSSSSDSLVYVETSATNGLLKSDGSVDTNSYIKDTELIPINSDLNDYTEAGFYACNLSTTDMQTLQNCPVTEGFSLLVEENKTFNETGYKQTLTTWGKNGKPQVYIRTYVYDDIYSNPPQVITSGWQLVYEDTGWQDMSFATGFGHYTTTQYRAVYRRIGKIVSVRGAVKNTNAFTPDANNGTTICTIGDTSCRPSQPFNFIQQGSGMNRFILRVDNDGGVKVFRYGTTSAGQVGASAFLNIACTFMVD